MEKEVLATNEAGAAINSSFINISLDMEKGDGLALKKKYNITAFPTLLYFNSNGEAVHKSVGATDLQGLFFNTR